MLLSGHIALHQVTLGHITLCCITSGWVSRAIIRSVGLLSTLFGVLFLLAVITLLAHSLPALSAKV